MSVVEDFAAVMGEEWSSIGLRGMYGYMADLSTEPRWYRTHETFTEDAPLGANIMGPLVETLQGEVGKDGNSLSPETDVALTMKHFPGGGPQELGFDPHYAFGKAQVYPGDAFGYHLQPFEAAIEAGVSSIMPYYGVPVDVTYEGVDYDEVGMAFSDQIVNGLLRHQMGFAGYVNSDTGIINDRAGASRIDHPRARRRGDQQRHRHPVRIQQGADDHRPRRRGPRHCGARRPRRRATARPDVRDGPVRGPVRRPRGRHGDRRQRREPRSRPRPAAQVHGLLQNQEIDGDSVLPLDGGETVYVIGNVDADQVAAAGYDVIDGNDPAEQRTAADADVALISMTARNVNTGTYASNSPATGLNPEHVNPSVIEGFDGLDGQSLYGESDACVIDGGRACTDNGLRFGGSFPWETSIIDFSGMADAESWEVTPSLDTVQQVMAEVGAENTVLDVYFRQPFVLDEASGLRDAGAILANFGNSTAALMDIVSGEFNPQGRMPFALAGTREAIIQQNSDTPGYDETDDGALYPYGFGLSYEE